MFRHIVIERDGQEFDCNSGIVAGRADACELDWSVRSETVVANDSYRPGHRQNRIGDNPSSRFPRRRHAWIT